MKICCDICGGDLVVQAGGIGAVCKICGMEHSVERVREMLGVTQNEKSETCAPKASEKPAASSDSTKKCENIKLTESKESDFVLKKGLFGSKLVGYNGKAQKVVFPHKINEVMGEKLFSGHDEIIELVFTDGISTTEGREFADCKNLKKITVHGNMNTMSDTFSGCKKLEQVNITAKINGDIVQIGENTFAGCKKLKEFTVSNDCEMEINTGAFKDCESLERFEHSGRTADFAGTGIKPYAFKNCTSLCEVVLADDTVSIHKGAFKNCRNLKKVVLKNGTEIDGKRIAIHPEAFEDAAWQPESVGVCPECGGSLKCSSVDGYESMTCSCGFESTEY